MPRCLPLDSQDKRALRALDNDFAPSSDGEVAVVEGEMEVTAVRLPDDDGNRFKLTIRFSRR